MQVTRLQTNRFAGRCHTCAVTVAEAQGWAALVTREPPLSGERWRTFCAAHKPDAAPPIIGGEPQPEPTEEPAPMNQPAPIDLDRTVDRVADRFLRLVPGMVADEVARLAPRAMVIHNVDAPPITLDTHHKALPHILIAVVAGASPFLVGPAGSGKTTLAEQCAKALGRPFYMAARVTSEFKLVGFVDAHGKTVRTQFREAYEKGGGFLFDEVDASDPDAMTTFNAALANGYCDFPDGMVQRHPDFFAIAAGNTFGRGADRQYVGRNQLDAATLDRFQVFEVDYDEALEAKLAGDEDWTRHVQRVRKAIMLEQVRHVVSPRASIMGARLLAAGLDRKMVEEATIWKGLPQDARQRVETRMPSC